ncbi:MAG: hypothetical protein DRP85_04075, partial [Candidatus Makaraimicrobium thalassicum]
MRKIAFNTCKLVIAFTVISLLACAVSVAELPYVYPGESAVFTYYDAPNTKRVQTAEVESEWDEESEFYLKGVKYYFSNIFLYLDSLTGKEYGRVYRIDVPEEGWYYEITYADPDDPLNSIILSKVKKDLTTDALLEEYTYDETGRLVRDDYVSENRYYTYTYYDSPNENQADYKYEYERDTGTLLYAYKYDLDGTPLVVYEYDAAGNIVGETAGVAYTYYEESGRIKTKELLVDGADPAGTIYEYSDEAIYNTGTDTEHGYLVKQTNPDGSYTTFSSSEYDDNDKLEKRTTYEAIYTYYVPSGRIYTKELRVAVDGDPAGTIYEYSDEGVHSVGSDAESGYMVKKTDPDGTYTTFTAYEYDTDGNLVSQTAYEALFTYYVPEGRIHTKYLRIASGDDPAGTTYEYSNDPVHNVDTDSEHGYLIKKTNPDGSYTTYSDYWSPDQPRFVSEYDAGGNLLAEYEYDTEGNPVEEPGDTIEEYDSTLMKRKIELATSDIYEYLEEDWFGQGYGRVTLVYDASETTYRTYDWDALQVTVEEYEGAYEPAAD